MDEEKETTEQTQTQTTETTQQPAEGGEESAPQPDGDEE